jgi:cytochrome bd ubiquinol oxidase subunit II
VLAGAVILLPSLALLFRLVLVGQLDHAEPSPLPLRELTALSSSRPGLIMRATGACLFAGIGLLTIAEAGWAHAAGVVCLFGFAVLGFVAVAPADLATDNP